MTVGNESKGWQVCSSMLQKAWCTFLRGVNGLEESGEAIQIFNK